MGILSDVFGGLGYLQHGDELKLQQQREADAHQDFLNEQQRIAQGGEAPQANIVQVPAYNALTDGSQNGTTNSPMGYDANGNRIPLYKQPSGLSPYAGSVEAQNRAWMSAPTEQSGQNDLSHRIAASDIARATPAYGEDINSVDPYTRAILQGNNTTSAGITDAQNNQYRQAYSLPQVGAASQQAQDLANRQEALNFRKRLETSASAGEPTYSGLASAQDASNQLQVARGAASTIAPTSQANLNEALVRQGLSGIQAGNLATLENTEQNTIRSTARDSSHSAPMSNILQVNPDGTIGRNPVGVLPMQSTMAGMSSLGQSPINNQKPISLGNGLNIIQPTSSTQGTNGSSVIPQRPVRASASSVNATGPNAENVPSTNNLVRPAGGNFWTDVPLGQNIMQLLRATGQSQ